MSASRKPKCKGEFVNGFVAAVVEISPAFERQILDILAENGIEDPAPQDTYPVDDVISSVSQLAEDVGPKTTSRIAVHQIRIPEWPEQIDTVEKALFAIDDMYQDAYVDFNRKYLGAFRFEKTGTSEGRGAVTDGFPYPESFAEGIFKGSLTKFAADNSLPTVSEADPKADEKAAYELRW